MFSSPYGFKTPITGNKTLTKNDDLAIFPASVIATYTLTLAQAAQKSSVFIVNNSAYPQVIAPASGDTLAGPTLLGAGQAIELRSDEQHVWYAFSAAGVASAGAGGSVIVSVSLTAALINGMFAAPVVLAPAPGSGRAIIVESIGIQIVRTSTQFAAGGAVELRYVNGSGAKVTADISAAVITGAAGTAYSNVQGVVTELVPVPNAAVVMTNATQAFTTGTGTAKVRMKYFILDFN